MSTIVEHTDRDIMLQAIEKRVLWLAVHMVHHANNVRPNTDGTKVGGHQTSSASVVTILTSLYFEYMQAGDKISIKPHASPVFHAIQYLLGNLHPKYLLMLREYQGLQSYPSQTKDPDNVDFSAGPVGLGAIAPNFAALVDAYNKSHGWTCPDTYRRFISVLGDAELDEGSVWEAIAEPAIARLNNVLWVVDLNRQSLDRIIPGIRVRTWREMLAANGWQVIDVKYGAKMKAAFEEPNGDLLRTCIDELSNEAYQTLLRLPVSEFREWLPKKSRFPADTQRLLSRWNDNEVHEIFWDLGGHCFEELRAAYKKVDSYAGPSVIFAYTMKGWHLPSAGHPLNHSVLLTDEQMEVLRQQLGIAEDGIWAAFSSDSAEGQFCSKISTHLQSSLGEYTDSAAHSIPDQLDYSYRGLRSTQQSFGTILTAISRQCPELADRVVTISPDVASSTNLGGWINLQKVWFPNEMEKLPELHERVSLKWQESPAGKHVELGISENNLFMALGQFGLSNELFGETLYPIGTVYDPFIRRGLDAFFYGVYAGAKFIVVGTPSGVTLSTEGGSHQSILSPSVGIEMPELAYYEPCFGKELEWILMDALEQIRQRTQSSYLRLTTKPVDQSLFPFPKGQQDREVLRKQVLQGAYRIVDCSSEKDYKPGENAVHLFAAGVLVPEAIQASQQLRKEGIFANVINVTGPGPLYHHYQECVNKYVQGGKGKSHDFLTKVIPVQERTLPIVTLIDGHPHALAWLGSALGTTALPLGVKNFGQSGSCQDIYHEHEIDVPKIMDACRGSIKLGVT